MEPLYMKENQQIAAQIGVLLKTPSVDYCKVMHRFSTISIQEKIRQKG